jgi:hypothetical protein
MTVLRLLCVLGAALTMTPVASAEIFKCIAKNGLDLYQNFPCELDSLGAVSTQPAPAKAASQVKSIQTDAPPLRLRAPIEPRAGMTAEEVRAIWGEPAEIVQDEPRSGRVAIWQYDDGRVVQINQKQRVISVQR